MQIFMMTMMMMCYFTTASMQFSSHRLLTFLRGSWYWTWENQTVFCFARRRSERMTDWMPFIRYWFSCIFFVSWHRIRWTAIFVVSVADLGSSGCTSSLCRGCVRVSQLAPAGGSHDDFLRPSTLPLTGHRQLDDSSVRLQKTPHCGNCLCINGLF